MAGVFILLEIAGTAPAERVFQALEEGGSMQMPIPWEINSAERPTRRVDSNRYLLLAFFHFAQRARCAAAIFSRASVDIVRRLRRCILLSGAG
jgi:hypothetical protein